MSECEPTEEQQRILDHDPGRHARVLAGPSGRGRQIGKATDLEIRIKTHATGNPEPLTRFDVIETEHASQCETYLHHRLRTRQYLRAAQSPADFFGGRFGCGKLTKSPPLRCTGRGSEITRTPPVHAPFGCADSKRSLTEYTLPSMSAP